MFKANNKETERGYDIFIVNFEHISHLVLPFLILTLNMYLPTGKTTSTAVQEILIIFKFILPKKRILSRT